MSNLFLTLIIAFIVIVIGIAALAIGWLITGRSKLQTGACGRNPDQKKSENCQETQSCHLCQTPSKEDEKPKNDLEEGKGQF